MEKYQNGADIRGDRCEFAKNATDVYELEQLRADALYGVQRRYTDELTGLAESRRGWLAEDWSRGSNPAALTDELTSSRVAFTQAASALHDSASEIIRTYAHAAEAFMGPKDIRSRHWRRIRNEVRERGATQTAIDSALRRASTVEARMAMRIVLDTDIQARLERRVSERGVLSPDLHGLLTSASSEQSQAVLRLALDAPIWDAAADIARKEGPESEGVQRTIRAVGYRESQEAMRLSLDELLWRTINTVAPALTVASPRVQQLLSRASSEEMRQSFFRQLSDKEHTEHVRLKSWTADDFLRFSRRATQYIFDRGDFYDTAPPMQGNGPHTGRQAGGEQHVPRAESVVPVRPDYEYEIDAAIIRMRAEGLPDNKIQRRLGKLYHPDQGGSEEAMKYMTRRISD